MTPSIAARPPRVAAAILMASQASSALGCSEVAAPSSRREYRSITVARYSFPDRVGISVMSPHHLVLVADAVKSRLTRSGNFGAFLSCLVNPLVRLMIRATSPCRRIESATVFSLTFQLASSRSAWTRGEPWVSFDALNAFLTATSTCSRRLCRTVGSRSIHLYNQDSETPSRRQQNAYGTR